MELLRPEEMASAEATFVSQALETLMAVLIERGILPVEAASEMLGRMHAFFAQEAEAKPEFARQHTWWGVRTELLAQRLDVPLPD